MINGIKRKNIFGDVVWEHPETGEWHRLDGPAVIYEDDCREYCINGRWHNINGPTVIWKSGDKEYWIDGKCYYDVVIDVNQKHQWLLISLKRKLIDKKEY